MSGGGLLGPQGWHHAGIVTIAGCSVIEGVFLHDLGNLLGLGLYEAHLVGFEGHLIDVRDEFVACRGLRRCVCEQVLAQLFARP